MLSQFDVTKGDCDDMNWFHEDTQRAIVVGLTDVSVLRYNSSFCCFITLSCLVQNNGLQRLPTNPTPIFISRMEMLFQAYLCPKKYYQNKFAITNNPERIADFLTSDDPGIEGEPQILSYRDERLDDCCFFRPCCAARTPDLELVLD